MDVQGQAQAGDHEHVEPHGDIPHPYPLSHPHPQHQHQQNHPNQQNHSHRDQQKGHVDNRHLAPSDVSAGLAVGPALPPKSPRMTGRLLKKQTQSQNQAQHQHQPLPLDQNPGHHGKARVEYGQGQGDERRTEEGNGNGTDNTGRDRDGYPPRPIVDQSGKPDKLDKSNSHRNSPSKMRFGRLGKKDSSPPHHPDQHNRQHRQGPPPHHKPQEQEYGHQHQQHHDPHHSHSHPYTTGTGTGTEVRNPPPNITIHPPSIHSGIVGHPSTAPAPHPLSPPVASSTNSPTRNANPNTNTNGPGPGVKSPLLERLKQTFISREPMSRTWARKSYQEELDSVAQVGDRDGHGGIENQSQSGMRGGGGRGMRSAPPSISDRGDIESQHHTQHQSSGYRPVSIYASPAAVAQFRALPSVGPGEATIPAHPAMRI